jgi:2,5-diketo-D-gluconate reductase B
MKHMGPIPQLGFGTWKRAGEDGSRAILQALDVGFRHIDTATAYDNEKDVGLALKQSGLPRQELFITTKVWPDNFGSGQVLQSAGRSLEKLGLDHVDLLLLHWPSRDHDMGKVIEELAKAQEKGFARSIGVSNFNRALLAEAISILGADRITTNQIEIHPLFQNTSMVAHMHGLGIAATAYSPLARGAIIGHPVLERIAKAHGASVGQIALAFLMAEGHVVIPTSTSPQRMAENFASQHITLGHEDITSLRAIDENRRMVDWHLSPDWNA